MSISAIINLNLHDNYRTATDFSCFLVWLCCVTLCYINTILPFYDNTFLSLLIQFLLTRASSLHCSEAGTFVGHYSGSSLVYSKKYPSEFWGFGICQHLCEIVTVLQSSLNIGWNPAHAEQKIQGAVSLWIKNVYIPTLKFRRRQCAWIVGWRWKEKKIRLI